LLENKPKSKAVFNPLKKNIFKKIFERYEKIKKSSRLKKNKHKNKKTKNDIIGAKTDFVI